MLLSVFTTNTSQNLNNKKVGDNTIEHRTALINEYSSFSA